MSKGVIETFFLDWGGAFGIGCVFGLAGRTEFATARSLLQTRAFRFGLAYFELAFLPIAIALYLARPDWMWMYWLDHTSLPIAVVVLAFAMYQLAFVAGFVIAPALEGSKRGAGIALALATGALLTAGEFAARTRLWHFGTLAEYDRGEGIDMLHSGTGNALIAVAVLSLIAFGLALRASRKGGSRAA